MSYTISSHPPYSTLLMTRIHQICCSRMDRCRCPWMLLRHWRQTVHVRSTTECTVDHCRNIQKTVFWKLTGKNRAIAVQYNRYIISPWLASYQWTAQCQRNPPHPVQHLPAFLFPLAFYTINHSCNAMQCTYHVAIYDLRTLTHNQCKRHSAVKCPHSIRQLVSADEGLCMSQRTFHTIESWIVSSVGQQNFTEDPRTPTYQLLHPSAVQCAGMFHCSYLSIFKQFSW